MDILFIDGFEIVNLCPHQVDMVHGGTSYHWDKSSKPARLAENIIPSSLGGVFTDVEFTGVIGLPDESEGRLFIVSLPMKLVLPRGDLLTPTGAIRDKKDRVIGCTSLSFRPKFSDELAEKLSSPF